MRENQKILTGSSNATALRRRRRRSSSFGNQRDPPSSSTPKSTSAQKAKAAEKEKLEIAKKLLQTVLSLQNSSSAGSGAGRRNLLHQDGGHSKQQHLALCEALLQRCGQVDRHSSSCFDGESSTLRRQFLLAKTTCSGYTPLHEAIYRADLATILFLLRQASLDDDGVDSLNGSSGGTPRKLQRPIALLHGVSGGVTTVAAMAWAVDHEGMTAADLLVARQRSELAACRQWLSSFRKRQPRRARTSSIGSFQLPPEDEQNEFDALSRALGGVSHRLGSSGREERDRSSDSESDGQEDAAAASVGTVGHQGSYGCEVVTFGRAHHCAMGVVASNSSDGSSNGLISSSKPSSSAAAASKIRPHRVPAFAHDTMVADGNAGGAVAVASATHHTLVVTASGHLYAFGLGQGGRLGTGNETPCAIPTRVLGPLAHRRVVGIAASENHSLCVTAEGEVYAWGSNRFGQLGTATSSTTDARCLPRRVDDLKHVVCTQVAAGGRHSVALSQEGQIYVWGDNSAGQLGISGRMTSSSSNKVHSVDALWKASPPKEAIAIAASDQTTLVLTRASGRSASLPVNSIYSWGHGNHVPCKVHFEDRRSDRQQSARSRSAARLINPIAIACARYHNVAVTADGLVYTWGFHVDSLGTSNRKQSPLATPQLVTGMLPENGGGLVVALSASDNHTAVVTDTGTVFTWGDTYKKNILGHEGVRFSPDPRRVPGVHRAVGVSVAKEHTVLLIGTSFPAIPSDLQPPIDCLEVLAARKVAEHVDLFNVIPVLTVAERTQTALLLDYCEDFIRRNLDGVLNVGQKSVMEQYLNEQLADCLLVSEDKDHRDGQQHPLLLDVVTAGTVAKPSFGEETLCQFEDWLEACKTLSEMPSVAQMIDRLATAETEEAGMSRERRVRRMSRSDSLGSDGEERSRTMESYISERCETLTTTMDLSSRALAEAKLCSLSKEARAVRKRLSQITKLEDSTDNTALLSSEQQRKLARRPQLEADLAVFEPAMEAVEKRLKELKIVEHEVTKREVEANANKFESPPDKLPDKEVSADDEEATAPESYRCELCRIVCPDKKSHELHMNGRKHRNRVAQVAEKEKKHAAASILEESRRQLLLQPTQESSQMPIKVRTIASPWNTDASSVQPKFNLPPPPHPIVDTASSPVATKPRIKSFREIMEEESRRSSDRLTVPTTAALQLPPGAAPAMKSPPWASAACVNVSQGVAMATPQKVVHTLGDFIERPKSKKVSARPLGWQSQRNTVEEGAAARKISFLDIQQEEQDFKAKQDQSYASNGKWFIERRERAGSFNEIQNEAAREREEQMVIEEQLWIERQILEELAAKKAAEEHASAEKHSIKPKNHRRKSHGQEKGRNEKKQANKTTSNQLSGSAEPEGRRTKKRGSRGRGGGAGNKKRQTES